MLKFIGKPSEVTCVALSGGMDSMVLLSFLRKAKHCVEAVYVNHGTPHAQDAEVFVRNACADMGVALSVYSIAKMRTGVSAEEFWREERYKILDKLGVVAMAHHLNDVAETYLFSSLHGKAKLIDYRRNNVVRPFLLNTRQDISEWAEKHKVPYINDPSNADLAHPRNRIRHEMMPIALATQPGFLTTVRKMVCKRLIESNAEALCGQPV